MTWESKINVVKWKNIEDSDERNIYQIGTSDVESYHKISSKDSTEGIKDRYIYPGIMMSA